MCVLRELALVCMRTFSVEWLNLTTLYDYFYSSKLKNVS